MAWRRLNVEAGEGTSRPKKPTRTNFVWTDDLNSTLLTYLYEHHLSETVSSIVNSKAAKHVGLVHSRLVTEANVVARGQTNMNIWGRIANLQAQSGVG